jgi:hypothetical protein
MVQPDFPKLPPGYDKSDDKFWKPTEEHNESKVTDKKMDDLEEKNVAIVPHNVPPGGSTATTPRSATDNSLLSIKASEVPNNATITMKVQHQS